MYDVGGTWQRSVYGIQLIGIAGSESTIIDRNGAGTVIIKEFFHDDFGSLIQGFTIQNAKETQGKGGGIFIDGEGTTLRDLIVKDCEAKNL